MPSPIDTHETRAERLQTYLSQEKFRNIRLTAHPNRERDDLVLISAARIDKGQPIFTEQACLSTTSPRASACTPSIQNALPQDWQRLLYQYLYLEEDAKSLLRCLSTDGVLSEGAKRADPTREAEWKAGVKKWIKKKKNVGVDEIMELVARIETNCHSAPLPNDDDDDDDDFAKDSFNEDVEENVGLWIAGSFMDHSCDPNATVSLSFTKGKDAVLTLRALKDIDSQDMITISYWDVEYLPRQERRRLLYPRGFMCSCQECSSEYDKFRVFSCEQCYGPVMIRNVENGLAKSQDDGRNGRQDGIQVKGKCMRCDNVMNITEELLLKEQHLSGETHVEDDTDTEDIESVSDEEKEQEILHSMIPILKHIQGQISSTTPPTTSTSDDEEWTSTFLDSPDFQHLGLHPAHQLFYNFMKTNLFHNSYFRSVLTNAILEHAPHTHTHDTMFIACFYLVLCCYRMNCNAEEKRWNTLWMCKMFLEYHESKESLSLPTSKTHGDWANWAANDSAKWSTIAFGVSGEEMAECNEILETLDSIMGRVPSKNTMDGAGHQPPTSTLSTEF